MHGMANEQTKSLTIGRIAQQADVGIDTIRFYERRGLLPKPQRTSSGYRIYTADIIRRLNFIRKANTLGFVLEEIISFLQLQDSSGAPAADTTLQRRKLEQIETKIKDLERMREVLSALEHDCAGTGDVRTCPIIEALSEAPLTDDVDIATENKLADNS